MKKINGRDYASEKEFVSALIRIDDRNDRDYLLGERYRAPGFDKLCFRTKSEASEFYHLVERY